MVFDLTNEYNGVGTLICQIKPLPPFYQARSMLIFEEVGLNKKSAVTGADMVTNTTNDLPHSGINSEQYTTSPKQNHGGRNSTGCIRGKQSGGRGNDRGGRSGNNCGGQNHGGQQRPSSTWSPRHH